MSASDEVQLEAKKWAVGVELEPDHLGPVNFAAALAEMRAGELVTGLHVVPNAALSHPMLEHEEGTRMRAQASAEVRDLMVARGLEPERIRVELVEHDAVEEGLGDAAERLGVDALVVGRRAKRDEDPLVRLGEVTRRLLRRLPVPTVVVPPDFGSSPDHGLGAGPVICGVDLSEHCIAAARWAATFAARLDRPLLLAHGTQAFRWGVSYIPAPTMDRLQAQTREGADEKLHEWAEARGLGDASRHVFQGDPAKELLNLANERDAAMLVSGSRLLSLVERLFMASVSSELAAAARCPVAVVPGA